MTGRKSPFIIVHMRNFIHLSFNLCSPIIKMSIHPSIHPSSTPYLGSEDQTSLSPATLPPPALSTSEVLDPHPVCFTLGSELIQQELEASSWTDEANRTISSAKRVRLCLYILSIKVINRISDKGQPCRSPTLPGNEFDLLHYGPDTPYSQRTLPSIPQGTRSNSFSKPTKHMWIG